jgi:hypothetical protein
MKRELQESAGAAAPLEIAQAKAGRLGTSLEAQVLGAILLTEGAALSGVRGILPDANYFPDKQHRAIYACMLALYDEGAKIDAPTLTETLKGQLENAWRHISDLAGATATAANAVQHALLLREAHARDVATDRLARLQRACENNRAPAELVAGAEAMLAEMRRTFAASTTDRRFVEAAVSAAALLARDIPKPVSLVGDGLITEGGFALLYGRPGLGKTWAVLELALCVARGEPWYGFATRQTRVGILQLELPLYFVQQRLREVAGDRTDGLDSISVLARPDLQGAVNLLDTMHRDGIATWCRERQLGMLVIDALSRVHQEDENSSKELGRVLAEFDRLREEASCAVVPVHHEPKAKEGRNGSSRDDHLDAARGSSRLQSDPQTLLRLHASRGVIALTAAKVNQGPSPAPVYLDQLESGRLVQIDEPPDPKEVGEANLEDVFKALPPEGEPGVLAVDVEKRTGLAGSTVRKHLRTLQDTDRAVKSGPSNGPRYNRCTG